MVETLHLDRPLQVDPTVVRDALLALVRLVSVELLDVAVQVGNVKAKII